MQSTFQTLFRFRGLAILWCAMSLMHLTQAIPTTLPLKLDTPSTMPLEQVRADLVKYQQEHAPPIVNSMIDLSEMAEEITEENKLKLHTVVHANRTSHGGHRSGGGNNPVKGFFSSCPTNLPVWSGPLYDMAVDMLWYARIASCADEISLKSWTCVPLCESPKTKGTEYIGSFSSDLTMSRAYVAVNTGKKAIIVSFRSSLYPINWELDLDTTLSIWPFTGPSTFSTEDVRVHAGGLKTYKAIRNQLIDAINHQYALHPDHELYIVGESLGGALAQLAAGDLSGEVNMKNQKINLFTYNAFRPGNVHFAELLAFTGINIHTVIQENDIVPHFPPRSMGYSRAGTEYYTCNHKTYICRGSEDSECSNSRMPVFNLAEHLYSFDIFHGGCTVATQMVQDAYLN